MHQSDMIRRTLTSAYRLIQKNGWCQGAEARDYLGNPVPLRDKTARSFCLIGAVLRSTPKGNSMISRLALLVLMRVEDTSCKQRSLTVVQTNDMVLTSKQQALDILQRAIDHVTP